MQISLYHKVWVNLAKDNVMEEMLVGNSIAKIYSYSLAPLSHSITPTSPISTMGPPASPITCLPSTSPPSALTSASRGKHRASTLRSDVDAPLGKHSCLPFATAKVQQEGSAAISSLASVMQEMSAHFSHNISQQDKLKMMLLFLKNKDEAVTFFYMNDELRWKNFIL
ncbi:hypothetical protein BDR05DRAFT_943317 [Suillus weaverae]|nr:hypothetical protein BDR05DRAFT_943317 [Suillus weaverae]